MEWLTGDFLAALLSIVLIDLMLAGDNAIVIGMAARNLPKEKQRSAILWGTVGAVVIRTIATVIVVWLLKIPAVLLIGGAVLIWIAYKLLVEKKDHDIPAQSQLRQAIQTIVVADFVMGLDNVIAVAGAAHGSFLLVVIGLIISVPIMLWCSTLFIKIVDKFPWIIYIGSALLAFTAGKMVADDPLVKHWFEANGFFKWALIVIVVAAVMSFGHWRKTMIERKLQLSGHTAGK
ncbi:TerC family protein [Paenibacillus cymbidii]|uniref:TerC family protein n=1 Tax=Paenibacillus cymbidii TaxID=1639034 RepID=UPI001080353A|nr:TerC family protein [Paenibacillus cymbidii]